MRREVVLRTQPKQQQLLYDICCRFPNRFQQQCSLDNDSRFSNKSCGELQLVATTHHKSNIGTMTHIISCNHSASVLLVVRCARPHTGDESTPRVFSRRRRKKRQKIIPPQQHAFHASRTGVDTFMVNTQPLHSFLEAMAPRTSITRYQREEDGQRRKRVLPAPCFLHMCMCFFVICVSGHERMKFSGSFVNTIVSCVGCTHGGR